MGVFSEQNYKSYCISLSGWNKVEHLGWIKQEKAPNTLKQCDLGMCILELTPAYVDSIPTKVLEYMSCSIPFISSELRFCETIVNKYKCGLIVKNDVNAIKKGILFYKEKNIERIKQGQNGLKAIQANYSWKNEEQKLLDSYKKVNKK